MLYSNMMSTQTLNQRLVGLINCWAKSEMMLECAEAQHNMTGLEGAPTLLRPIVWACNALVESGVWSGLWLVA